MIVIKVSSENERLDAFSVRTSVFVNEQKVPLEIEMDEFDQSAIHFVGYESEEPVAAARIRFENDYGKLERICILPAFRGKYLGEQIVREMEKEIAAHHYKKAKLHAQTHAKAFYERFGYQVISDEFIDAGIPHVAMLKHLK